MDVMLRILEAGEVSKSARDHSHTGFFGGAGGTQFSLESFVEELDFRGHMSVMPT